MYETVLRELTVGVDPGLRATKRAHELCSGEAVGFSSGPRMR